MASERIIADAIMSPVLRDYRIYKLGTQNRSEKTVGEYLTDLRLFFKFIIAEREGIELFGEAFESISLSRVDAAFLDTVKPEEIYEFMLYLRSERGDSARTGARKLSSIKMLYKYASVVSKICKSNPARDIEGASIKTGLPKFLTLDESRALLDSISGEQKRLNRSRDYAIIMLFLNTGMRLSELVSINLEDFDPSMTRITVIGKRRKERAVYINDAAREAVAEYLHERSEVDCTEHGRHPLFLSTRKRRICDKTVQKLVEKHLRAAGLEYRRMSTHKLRHTAATLMYREGGVDVRVLQEILGHEQLNTTQIYTHVLNEDVEKAVKKNPLANYTKK